MINKDKQKQGSQIRGFNSLHPLTLLFNELRIKRSSNVAPLPLFLSLPLPLLAVFYRREMFPILAFLVALACLAVAIWKVFSLSERIRRLGEPRRLARWWERRGERWMKAQREGFRP